jgi:hypothetical protein
VKVVVLHEASEELSDAAVWYENEREGLGADLLAEAAHVFAFGHTSRRPGYWRDRLKK